MFVSHINPTHLLKINSHVEDHYSTPLIVDTLNTYLCNAAELLFNETDYFKAQILCLISVYQTDHRKQIAAVSFDEVQKSCIEATVTNEFSMIKNLYLDRSIIYSLVNSFMTELDVAKSYYIKSVKKPTVRRVNRYNIEKTRLGVTTDVLNLYNNVKSWLNLYIEFRNSIISN